MRARLLIVDRDARYGEWLRHHLGVLCPDAGVSVLPLEQLGRMADGLTRTEVDLLLLAAPFGTSPEDPRSEGLEWLRQVRERPEFPPVIAIAEDGNELTAVRALQLGAVDYLPKRLLTPERLGIAVHLALRALQRRARCEAQTSAPAPAADRAEALPADAGQAGAASEPPADAAAAAPQPHDPLATTSTTALRTLIPGYFVCSKLGESEKAFVYRATSATLGRDVALKVSKGRQDEADEHQFLAREHAALSAIRHPSIVEIHDYGTHEGHEYIAMEYFPRGDLKARLARGIDEDECLRLLEQIASALRVVHHAGLLHRDLKPPNVMLRENGDVVLIDFGLARSLHAGMHSTRTGVLRGSPYYMSPEQALGEELDARTDLYSLGVIYYEMLTGRKLYTGSSAMEVLQQHVNAPVPRLPEPLARHQPLLDRLLAKAREERFGSAEEVLAAIAAAREPAEAAPDAA